jgi:hypothetical protein
MPGLHVMTNPAKRGALQTALFSRLDPAQLTFESLEKRLEETLFSPRGVTRSPLLFERDHSFLPHHF